MAEGMKERISSGTKVRIGSGHFGYLQEDQGDRCLIVFFGYPVNGLLGIHEYWIAKSDVTVVTS